jgi:hypothetical protein
MEIPSKIVIYGDHAAGKNLIGSGHRQMQILENLMRFQNLDQYAIKMSPYPGAIITCRKVFGLRTIEIFTSRVGESPRSEDKRKCMCFPHASFGVIEKVTPAEPKPEEYGNTAAYDAAVVVYRQFLINRGFRYDVWVCKGRSYTLVTDVYSPGWGRYYPGQFVMVSMGEALVDITYPPFDCDRNCLMGEPRFPTLVIVPIHVTDKMKEWFRI